MIQKAIDTDLEREASYHRSSRPLEAYVGIFSLRTPTPCFYDETHTTFAVFTLAPIEPISGAVERIFFLGCLINLRNFPSLYDLLHQVQQTDSFFQIIAPLQRVSVQVRIILQAFGGSKTVGASVDLCVAYSI